MGIKTDSEDTSAFTSHGHWKKTHALRNYETKQKWNINAQNGKNKAHRHKQPKLVKK